MHSFAPEQVHHQTYSLSLPPTFAVSVLWTLVRVSQYYRVFPFKSLTILYIQFHHYIYHCITKNPHATVWQTPYKKKKILWIFTSVWNEQLVNFTWWKGILNLPVWLCATATPSAPHGITMLSCDGASMIIAWKSPKHCGGSKINAYYVDKRDADTLAWKEVNSAPTKTRTYTVRNVVSEVASDWDK